MKKYFFRVIYIILIFLFILNKGYSDSLLLPDNNLPPENIYNIKNENGSKIPTMVMPAWSAPYNPVLIMGRNFGNENSNITVFIGKIQCMDVIHFDNKTTLNKTLLNIDFGSIYGDINDSYSMNSYIQDRQYVNALLNYTYRYQDVQIIKCNLQTPIISSEYLKAQNVYIVVDGVLGIEKNAFSYKDVSKCADNTDICNNNGICYLGVCLCNSSIMDGPLCDLKRNISILEKPIISSSYPEIVYSNSNSSWLIKFNELQIIKKTISDSRQLRYDKFINYRDPINKWKLIDTSSNLNNNNINNNNYNNKNNNSNINFNIKDNTNDESIRYQLITNDITTTIDVISVGSEREIDFYPGQPMPSKFNIGDLRISITLSNLSEKYQDLYSFKMIFEIQTIIEPKLKCGSKVDFEPYDFQFGKGFDRDDIRWISTTSNFSTLYCRFFGKCFADQAPQTCAFDLDEDPKTQDKGDATMFIYFEPFHYNVTAIPDFKIITFAEFPNITFIPCKEFLSKTDVTAWLIPTIVPIIGVTLICLTIVVFNIIWDSEESLTYKENDLLKNRTKNRITIYKQISCNDIDDYFNDNNNNNINNNDDDNNNNI
ncbi:hypothetical protein ACTFIV_001705 [Dictyostelium citrinum]